MSKLAVGTAFAKLGLSMLVGSLVLFVSTAPIQLF